MLEAFREIGYDPAVVSGHSGDRKRAYAKLRDEIRRGRTFEFCYAETTTMPMALGDPGHLPLRPLTDLRFMGFLKRHQVPFFPFYRDIHWLFPSYGERLRPWKRSAALFFYRFEFERLVSIAERLYLPSEQMKRYLPGNLPRYGILPPGSESIPLPPRRDRSGLKILYVGGVTPPIYDLSEFLTIVEHEPFFSLTIACREGESDALKRRCKVSPNIRIIHRSSEEMSEEYAAVDIASLFLGSSEYFSMAMPVKLLEAVGFGVPVLAREGTEAGDFVARENVGWVASGPEEARAILRRLAGNPGELEAMRRNVREAAPRHTWAERARQVALEAESVRASISAGKQG
jgi:hypothetical protein